MGSLSEPAPYRVLVIGGAYAGLSAALSICDMAAGRPARTSGEPIKAKTPLANGVDVTIVDERDGYCTNPVFLFAITPSPVIAMLT